MSDVPKREDAKHECKAADFLAKDAAEVVRPIVAFLNSNGGTLWTGIRESGGALIPEGVPDAERERVRLRDRIIDTIEPTPSDSEVKVEVRSVDGHLLVVVEIEKGHDPPYAARRGSLGREYLIRSHDRTRLMSREELREKFARTNVISTERVERTLQTELEKLPAGLHVLIAPEHGKTNLKADGLRARLEAILTSPETAHNRPMGWTFHNPYHQLRPMPGGLQFGESNEADRVLIRTTGFLSFFAPLSRLLWTGTHGPNPEQAIHPLPLIELTVSATRIAAQLFKTMDLDSEQLLFVGLGLIGVRGWTLAPHSPQSFGHQLEDPATAPDSILTHTTTARLDSLVERPDAPALKLLADVYWDFGFEPSKLPVEIDRKEELLRLN